MHLPEFKSRWDLLFFFFSFFVRPVALRDNAFTRVQISVGPSFFFFFPFLYGQLRYVIMHLCVTQAFNGKLVGNVLFPI